MRFYTRGLNNGELSEDEENAAVAGYHQRLDEISDLVPEPLLRLARDISLHDGVIEGISWNPVEQALQIDVIAGDLQEGYFAVSLRYGGAMLGAQRLEVLQAVARDRETEILDAEIDIGADGVLSHRILFFPRDELTIDFTTFDLVVEPRADRRTTLGRAFDLIEADEDEG